MEYHDVFPEGKVIIGMVHLLPLLGHEKHISRQDVTDRALHDAEALLEGGIRYAIVENDGDRPFGITNLGYNFTNVRCEMIFVGQEIHKRFPELTLGVQVLNNYDRTPVIVEEIGGKFLRSQFYGEQRIDPDGRQIYPCCSNIYFTNQEQGRGFVVLADIDSKGSTPREGAQYDAAQSIAEHVHSTFRPHALITTGTETGVAPDKEQVGRFRELVNKHAPDMPVGVGSGTTPEAIRAGLIEPADFAIVGSYFKTDGRVDPAKVKTLVQAVEEMHSR